MTDPFLDKEADMAKPTRESIYASRPSVDSHHLVTAGDVIAAHFGAQCGATDERYPLQRTGDRPKLPTDLWRAVYHRDKGTACDICGQPMNRTAPADLEIDHIVPWSAGGRDTGYNLRLTHKACNQNRSNYRHRSDEPRKPITFACPMCDPDAVPLWETLYRAFCGNCRQDSYTKLEWMR